MMRYHEASLRVTAAILAAIVCPLLAGRLYAADCNGNGIDDACDLSCGAPGCDVPGCGLSGDYDGHGIPDECEIAPGLGYSIIPDDPDEPVDGWTLDVAWTPGPSFTLRMTDPVPILGVATNDGTTPVVPRPDGRAWWGDSGNWTKAGGAASFVGYCEDVKGSVANILFNWDEFVQTVASGGPTERVVDGLSVGLSVGPFSLVSVGLAGTIKFAVEIDGSYATLLNQNATIESLVIDPLAELDVQDGCSLTVRNPPILNHGVLAKKDGAGTFSINQALTNTDTGVVEAASGSLVLPAALTNDGMIWAANGGTIGIAGATADTTLGLVVSEWGGTVNISSSNIVDAFFEMDGQLNVWQSTFVGGTVQGVGNVSLEVNDTLDGTTSPVTLAGVTTNGSFRAKGRLINDGTIRLAGAGYCGTITQATLIADGNVTLSGTGRVAFGQARNDELSCNDAIVYVNPGDVLTVEAGQTITNEQSSGGDVRVRLLNRGLVDADGGIIRLADQPKVNEGTMRASNGGTLQVFGVSVDNQQGLFEGEAGTSIYAYGASLSGGIVDTAGTFQLAGTSTLLGVRVKGGGTVVMGGSGVLDGVAAPVHLDDVTTTGSFTIRGNVVNDGTIRLGGEGYCGSQVYLTVDGNATLSGTGRVAFARGRNDELHCNDAITYAHSAAVLTVEAGQTVTNVQGCGGNVRTQLVNRGHIDANGGTIVLEDQKKTNDGLMEAENGGRLRVTVDVDGTGRWLADGGTISVSPLSISTSGDIRLMRGGRLEVSRTFMTGRNLRMDQASSIAVFMMFPPASPSTLALTGHVSYAMTDESKWSWQWTSVLEMDGGVNARRGDPANWASLEIAGSDNGNISAGYTNNFNLPQLVIGPGAHVYLCDMIDNGNRGGPSGFAEALYVDTLTFADPCGVLNVNGLRLYYKTLAGDPAQIIDEPFENPTWLRADADADGDVDLADFSAFQTCFNGPNRLPAAADCSGWDADDDGDVDLSDFSSFQSCFNGPNRSPACVPSPMSVVLEDFDVDGDVDLADFAHFQGCFNGPNRAPAQRCCADADLDADNDVDLADFASFQQCFNGPNRRASCR